MTGGGQLSITQPCLQFMGRYRWRPSLGCSGAPWRGRRRGESWSRPAHTAGPSARQTGPGRSKVSDSSQHRTQPSPGGGSPRYPRNISSVYVCQKMYPRRKRRQQPSGLFLSGKPPRDRWYRRTEQNCLDFSEYLFYCSFSSTMEHF